MKFDERTPEYRAGLAMQALMALAFVEENLGVRKTHLKVAKKWMGGSAEYSTWRQNPDAVPYALDVSTSSNPIFRAQIAKNLNAVAEKADRMFVPMNNTRPVFVQFEEGDRKYAALLKGRSAYMAAWTSELKSSGRPLLITQMKILPYMEQMEMPEVRGGRASDEMSAAIRWIAAQDMMRSVSLRPTAVSFREALSAVTNLNISGGFAGFADTDALIWDDISRSWSRNGLWYDGNELNADGATADSTLFKELESMRVYLSRAELASMSRYEGDEILPKLRQLALRLDLLSKDYIINAADTDAVAADTDAVAAVGDLANEAVDIGHYADALEGGGVFEICYPGYCGGITDVVGGIFSKRMRDRLTELIQRTDALINEASAGANAAEVREEMLRLYEEFREIAEAFYSHVGGSLQLVTAERMLRDVVPDSQLEDRHKELSGIGSELALLQGHMEFLKPEEAHVIGRTFKYGFISREIVFDQRKATAMIVRMKENGNNSRYVAVIYYYYPNGVHF